MLDSNASSKLARRLLLAASFSFLGLALSPEASALPPDPGNTCGGSGMCEFEADDAVYWAEVCESALFDVDLAWWDFQACNQACQGAGIPGLQCYSDECLPESQAWFAASATAEQACTEDGIAQSLLESCISDGCD